jgi:hypothetical protein
LTHWHGDRYRRFDLDVTWVEWLPEWLIDRIITRKASGFRRDWTKPSILSRVRMEAMAIMPDFALLEEDFP